MTLVTLDDRRSPSTSSGSTPTATRSSRTRSSPSSSTGCATRSAGSSATSTCSRARPRPRATRRCGCTTCSPRIRCSRRCRCTRTCCRSPKRLLDRGCLLSGMTAIDIGPGEHPQPMHGDDIVMARHLPLPHVPMMVTSMWALTDFTADNGGTRFVPGSHRFPQTPESPDAPLDVDVCALEMPAGSVMVFHGSLWHAGGANVTDDDRRLGVNVQYCPGFVRQQQNPYLGIPPEIAATFSDRLLELARLPPLQGDHGPRRRREPGRGRVRRPPGRAGLPARRASSAPGAAAVRLRCRGREKRRGALYAAAVRACPSSKSSATARRSARGRLPVRHLRHRVQPVRLARDRPSRGGRRRRARDRSPAPPPSRNRSVPPRGCSSHGRRAPSDRIAITVFSQ